MTVFVSRNPRNGCQIAWRASWQAHEIESALVRSTAAARAWAGTDMATRQTALRSLAAAIRTGASTLVTQIEVEVGKLHHEALDEVTRCAKWCDFLADHAMGWLADERNTTGIVARQAHGVVLAITPWNYPLWQILRPVAAALAAGNAVLVKPSESVSATASLFEVIARDVLPPHLVQCLWTDELDTRRAIAHPAVDMVVCTGSETTGRQIATLAAHHLKPAVLELGGNNAFIILDDADIDAAARAAADSRCLNVGQACTAAKRLIVHRTVYDRFCDALLNHLGHYRCGETLAPLARESVRDRLDLQVRVSRQQGARCLLGGAIPARPGFFYPPTVLDQVAADMPVVEEEVFGPVLTLDGVGDDHAAITLANSVRQALACSVWSADRDRAAHMASQLRAGMRCINQRPTSRFELPFAGVGASGYGSTLGRDGLLAFTRPVAYLSLPASTGALA